MSMVLNMKNCCVFLGLAFFGLCQASATEQATEAHGLHVFKDMQKDAVQASSLCVPMVIMVSQFSCAYCEKLRQQVLLPLLKSREFDIKALFRELLIDPDEFVTDLTGRSSTGMQVASGYLENIVTPTMLIIDASGKKLVEPIVGISNIDFYSAYLEAQINSAYQKTKTACSIDQVKKLDL